MNRLTLVTMALLLVAGSLCTAQSAKHFTAEIKNIGNAKMPNDDLTKHKHHDAEFFRLGDHYMVTYHQSEKDTLRSHGAI